MRADCPLTHQHQRAAEAGSTLLHHYVIRSTAVCRVSTRYQRDSPAPAPSMAALTPTWPRGSPARSAGPGTEQVLQAASPPDSHRVLLLPLPTTCTVLVPGLPEGAMGMEHPPGSALPPATADGLAWTLTHRHVSPSFQNALPGSALRGI